MNRTLALLLAVAVLFAHMLAIHTTSSGVIAPPYDDAHATFRIARNLVETRGFAWDPGTQAVESFPSFLWVLVAAVGTRLELPVTSFCQTVGTLSALLSVLVLARFSPGRLAGVIAPVLFVVAGGVAAAAASGTEIPLFSLFSAAAFLAFERRARRSFGALLAACVLTRDEGVAFAAMLLALELAGAWRARGAPRTSLLAAFLPAVLAFAGLTALRLAAFGTALSPTIAAWFAPDATRLHAGLEVLRDFVLGSGWTVLLVFPLYYLLRLQLSGFGRRALLLSLGYAALSAYQGGGAGPMTPALVPTIALFLIAIQESMTLALDSSRRYFPQATWAMFLTALSLSMLASKFPGDLGPIPIEPLHRAWVEKAEPRRLSYLDPLGRLGLDEELDATQRLRQLAGILRERCAPSETLLTPWPGALGYLTRLRAIDAQGRATRLPWEPLPRPWNGPQRVDVLRLLELQPNYIVPSLNWSERPPTVIEVAEAWLRFVDDAPPSPERGAAVREALHAYELITVPVPIDPQAGRRGRSRPFHLLRLRSLERAPRLEVERQGERFHVLVRHTDTLEQLVDLRVTLLDDQNRTSTMLPTGELREGATGMMRTSILIPTTDTRAIRIAEGTLPPGGRFTALVAVLRNPQARAEHKYALASESADLRLR